MFCKSRVWYFFMSVWLVPDGVADRIRSRMGHTAALSLVSGTEELVKCGRIYKLQTTHKFYGNELYEYTHNNISC